MKSKVAAASPNLSCCYNRTVAGRTPSLPCGWAWPGTEFSRVERKQKGRVPIPSLGISRGSSAFSSLSHELEHCCAL